MDKQKSKVITIYIREDLKKQVEDIAREDCRSFSNMVSCIIQDYMKTKETEKKADTQNTTQA